MYLVKEQLDNGSNVSSLCDIQENGFRCFIEVYVLQK